MNNNLLTVGEFADLARTTKRTVLWYEEKAILKPKAVDPENGYRLYEPDQIIDFQAILLLRRLNFSIREIKTFLAKHNSPEDIFNLKKEALKEELINLQTALDDTERYYSNLRQTGTLVNPKIKTFKPFPIFYIDKVGPYKSIGDYFEELKTHFSSMPKNSVGLTIYEDIGYQPKNAKVKICFTKRPGLKPKVGAKGILKEMVVPGFRGLSYTHTGSSKLLSMLWQELKKYRVKNGYKEDKSLPFEDLELYHSEHTTEMLMPIM